MKSMLKDHVAVGGVVMMLGFALASCDKAPPSSPPKDPTVSVTATVETVAMQDADDAADDPAIWIDAEDPSRSVIIGTNKKRGLGVYGLDGQELSFRADGRMNNVDVRQNVTIGAMMLDVVVATNRTDQTLAVYAFERAARALRPLLSIPSTFGDPYGICLYHSKTGELYVFANDSDSGTYGQWRLFSPDGTAIQAEKLRTFSPGSQAEGCSADDQNGTLFVSEEDVGIWAYGAEPKDGDTRVGVDTVAGGHLTADSEGISLVDEGNGAGYVIASSQGSNSYNVYDRAPPYAFRGAFVIGDGATIDGVAETDGLDVSAANLSPAFPGGVFVAQDGFNVDGPGHKTAHQNFKLVPWEAIRAALKLPRPPATAAENKADFKG